MILNFESLNSWFHFILHLTVQCFIWRLSNVLASSTEFAGFVQTQNFDSRILNRSLTAQRETGQSSKLRKKMDRKHWHLLNWRRVYFRLQSHLLKRGDAWNRSVRPSGGCACWFNITILNKIRNNANIERTLAEHDCVARSEIYHDVE